MARTSISERAAGCCVGAQLEAEQFCHHRAAKQKVLVLSPRSAELHGKIPEKKPADTSKMIISPMPGLVASIAVRKGQKLTAGDVVLTIEAMKMETVLHAERDGEVAGILVKPGGQIDAKDLLVVFA